MNHDTNVHRNSATASAARPGLTVLFEGLFFMCFAGQTDPTIECQVGFVTTAPGHDLSVRIIESVELADGVREAADYTIDLSTAWARSIDHMAIEIPGLDATPRVTRKGHKDPPIDRQRPDDENKHFFQWIIDLESPEMHPGGLTPVRDVLRPVLKIKAGEFYTAKLSQEGDSVNTAYKYVRVEGNMKEKDFGAVAEVVGVRINDLPQNQALLKAGPLTIPLIRKQDSSCLVHFKNRRPPHTHQEKDEDGNCQHPSDFPLYYHAFRDVNPLNRFDFRLKGGPHAFPPAICYSSTGSVTTSIP